MATEVFALTGLTCEHCAHAVTTELSQLPGVVDVRVELAAGATSHAHVTSAEPLSRAQIIDALDEAGDYQLITEAQP